MIKLTDKQQAVLSRLLSIGVTVSQGEDPAYAAHYIALSSNKCLVFHHMSVTRTEQYEWDKHAAQFAVDFDVFVRRFLEHLSNAIIFGPYVPADNVEAEEVEA
jgi:hypothetical protein